MGEFQGLNDALRLLRKRRGLRQWELAEQAGTTRQLVNAYENGRTMPSLSSLDNLMTALEIDKFDLVNALEVVNGRPERESSLPRYDLRERRDEILLAFDLADLPRQQGDLFLAQLDALKGWFAACRTSLSLLR